MDSFEFNKIAGALLGSLLFLVGLNIAPEAIFAPAKPAKPGYLIEIPKGDAVETAKAAPEESIEKLLASASVERGQSVAKICGTCHTFDKGGPNRVGPNLFGIVGDNRGEGRNGFNFSAAMKAKGGTWTFDDLNQFLTNPKAFVPGTAMGFAGISKDSQRADVIAYLRTLSDSPVPLPTAASK